MKKIYVLLFSTIVLYGCADFLDEKPRKGLVIPETLEHLNGLMLKEAESLQDPMWGEISSDDYYLKSADLASKDESYRNAYLWSDNDVFGTGSVNNWLFHYRFIYYANTVLEKLSEITPTVAEKADWERLMGEALFYRGKFHYDIAIIWADAYQSVGSDKLLGIPLRLHTNFNETSVRSSLEDTYHQILRDIGRSIDYLPDVSAHVTRPSKLAARAMAARIYLSMGNFEKALDYAEAVIAEKNDLLDFRQISSSEPFPMPIFNQEVILHAYMLTNMRNIQVNIKLMELFTENDLRKALFFVTTTNDRLDFKGSYYGRATLFSGLATDEMFLIASESAARTNQEQKAKDYLRTLMTYRYATEYVPDTNRLTGNDLLNFILEERRKELVFRGLRWGDVKRLNKLGYEISMERYHEDGTVELLPPNSPKFNLPIPQGIIDMTGMEQNVR